MIDFDKSCFPTKREEVLYRCSHCGREDWYFCEMDGDLLRCPDAKMRRCRGELVEVDRRVRETP